MREKSSGTNVQKENTMRRMIALLLAALMLVAMTACGAKNETTDTSAPADTAAA